MHRAHALLEIKSYDDDKRTITGIATTPTPDNMGDVVEPTGAQFKLPLPLLLHHDRTQPIGNVTKARVTAKGIEITAQLAKVDEPGELKARLDTAWQSIKAGLIRGLSIGFKPIEMERLSQDTYARRFTKWLWAELSAVTIPANGDATITGVKHYDVAQTVARPALGDKGNSKRNAPVPGVTGTNVVQPTRKVDPVMKTIKEQIEELEAERETLADRIKELNDEAGEEMAGDIRKEFDAASTKLDELDDRLKRLRTVERAMATATPALARQIPTAPRIQRTVNEDLDKGIRYARYLQCRALAAHMVSKGTMVHAADVAKSMYPKDGQLRGILTKEAVDGGTTTHSTWAKPLVGDETSMFADFAEFLRPMTILGKFGTGNIPALRRVPFRVPLIGQTSGGTGYWVGEGKAKPVTKFDFARTTLTPLKAAAIAVITMELMRDSSPSAAEIVRDQLAKAVQERQDIDFIHPAKAANVPAASPASITNGITPFTSVGNDADAIREDIKALFGAFVTANNTPTSGVWIMPAVVALALSLLVHPGSGNPEFPNITVFGGTLFGLPVITSEYVPDDDTVGTHVVLVNASDIYYADDGEVTVDMSMEASLEMDDAPTGDASEAGPTATSLVSMWQTNAVAFRAERTINWKRRRDQSVAVLDGVQWGAPTMT